MKTPRALPCLLALIAFAAPASAQLVHLSLEIPDASAIIHANDASIPWDHSGAFVTSFDVYYDGRLDLGAPLDRSRNFGRMHFQTFDQLPSFDVIRPLQSIATWTDTENGTGLSQLTFDFSRHGGTVSEDFELDLVFKGTLPESGKVPLPPFPELGSSEYTRSGFSFYAGSSFLDYPGFAEMYGGGEVTGLSYDFTPVPEPSTYAIGSLVFIGLAVVARRYRRKQLA